MAHHGVRARSSSGITAPGAASLVPAEALCEVARLSRNVAKGQKDVVTDDAMLAGWLEVKLGQVWKLRFLQLRSGSLTSYACSASRSFALTPDCPLKTPPVPEQCARWLPQDFTCGLTIVEPTQKCPLLLCTPAQLEAVRATLAQDLLTRIVVCFRPSATAGEAPIAVCVRIAPGVVHVFDLEDPVEYTLIALTLQATDEAVSVDFPFGLMVSSAQSDQMFVPLDQLFLAAQTPFIILQWMGGLRNADLDPQPVASRPSAAAGKVFVSATGTRNQRSASGALVAQLVSGAVGRTQGSFSGVDEVAAGASTQQQKANLQSLLKAITWDAHKAPALEAVLSSPQDRATLAEFCKTIFTEENVNFIIAVETFRHTRDARARQVSDAVDSVAIHAHARTDCVCGFCRRQQLARDITTEFINYSGKSVVNMDGPVRRRIEDVVASGVPVPPNVFDAAVDCVKQLIDAESFPKFLARLREVQDDQAVSNSGPHSWDSDDSSSFEERGRADKGTKKVRPTKLKPAVRMQRSDSLMTLPDSDFGDSGAPRVDVDMDKLRGEVAAEIEYDPADPVNLKHLLAKKSTRRLLHEFAKTILAAENVMFWEHIQRFRAATNQTDRRQQLNIMFEDFVPVGSKSMVNIAGTERARLMKLYGEKGALLADNQDLFDTALVECIKVMELDLYPKFLALLKDVSREKSAPKPTPKAKMLPLWEMLNDPDELNSLLLFATSNNQQDDILFWCLVQRYRLEADAETRGRLALHLMQNYVSANAPRMIRVDKSKKVACQDRYAELLRTKAPLPSDLFDAIWRDAQTSMNKHLHPAYEKFLRKGAKKSPGAFGTSAGSGSTSGTGSAHGSLRHMGALGTSAGTGGGEERNLLEEELEEAMRESARHAKWVSIKQPPSASAAEPPVGSAGDKKKLLGGKRGVPKSPRGE